MRIFSGTSANEMAVQNVWLSGALSEVRETVAHIWPQVVEIAALQEFYKMIDSSQPPCDTYCIWLTFLELFILLT
jgi:hypothetical protein